MRNNLKDNLEKLKNYKIQKFGEPKVIKPLVNFAQLDSLVKATQNKQIVKRTKATNKQQIEIKPNNDHQLEYFEEFSNFNTRATEKIVKQSDGKIFDHDNSLEYGKPGNFNRSNTFQNTFSSNFNGNSSNLRPDQTFSMEEKSERFLPPRTNSEPNFELKVNSYESDKSFNNVSNYNSRAQDKNYGVGQQSEIVNQYPSSSSNKKNNSSPSCSKSSTNINSIRKSITQSTINYKSGFPWDEEVRSLNLKVFKNKSFRQNQQEIINAVLSQQDVFVIMPTGGGKSLTFQLPALLSPGISIVIMPLISLIIDQLKRLQDLGIGARELNSNQGADEQNKVFDDIITSQSIKILFATPEKLSQSNKLNWFLKKLEERGRLSRFVIDEAHCVSKWGREFRKDYNKLSKFRQSFPNVPIVALTGTATVQVIEDVITTLNMREPAVFKSSFNRPNLFFEVRNKTKNAVDQMHKIIMQNYPNDSGLIYCSTKKDCEKVVNKLKQSGVSVEFFHSEVSYQDKIKIQQGWMTGSIKILVATIAFGMGIDKQAVRFVFHYSIPKSLENYYQEAGRAGRDGKNSLCTIFYKYSDKGKLDYLIGQSNELDQQELNFQELQSIIAYCEDIYTCRRKQQLAYFNEEFDPANCNRTCDNCKNGLAFIEKDVTEIARIFIRTLKENRDHLNTLIQIINFVNGKKKGKKDMSRFAGFGVLKDESYQVLEQTMKKMVQLDILKEKSVKLFKNNTMTKIELGCNARKVENNQLRVLLKIEIAKKKENLNFDSMFPEFELDLGMINDEELAKLGVGDQFQGKEHFDQKNNSLAHEKKQEIPAKKSNKANLEPKKKNSNSSTISVSKPLDFNFELNLDEFNGKDFDFDSDFNLPQTKEIEKNTNNLLADSHNFEIYDNYKMVSDAPEPELDKANIFSGINYDELDFPELNYEVYSPKINNLPEPASKSSHTSSLKFLEFGKCGNKDLYEEIMMKLLVVRENVSKRLSKSPDDIISITALTTLCKDLPSSGPYPSEFYMEIEFFKSLNQVRDDYSFTFDLNSNSIKSKISSTKSPGSDPWKSSEKHLKYS